MNVFVFLLVLVSSFSFPVSVSAQCPICIVTVGGGMLIAKKLGIDDFLVSIWISALNTAIAFYLADKMKIKNHWLKIFKNPWFLSFVFLLLTLIYFVTSGQTGHVANKLLGLDKVIFGQTLGMIVMFIGNFIYGYTKYKNDGKALFPYSKVVFPVGLVLIITLAFKLGFHL
ncbi:MAG: hypothetical protein WAV41_01855 [Microgenomates group bacterium]